MGLCPITSPRLPSYRFRYRYIPLSAGRTEVQLDRALPHNIPAGNTLGSQAVHLSNGPSHFFETGPPTKTVGGIVLKMYFLSREKSYLKSDLFRNKRIRPAE